MRIGFLMNMYPITSTTFIRREIHAIEEQGVEVMRYAIRPWAEELVDDRDKAEKDITFYLLVGRLGGLLMDFAKECVTNPVGVARTLSVWTRLWRSRHASGHFIT